MNRYSETVDKKQAIAKDLEKLGGRMVDFNFEFEGLRTW